MDDAADTYTFFVEGTWIFKSDKLYQYYDRADQNLKSVFNIEIQKLNWEDYIYNFVSGMCVWCLKEQKISPEHKIEQVLSNQNYKLLDIHQAYNSFKNSELSTAQAFHHSRMHMSLRQILPRVMEGLYVKWNGLENIQTLSKKNLLFIPVNTDSPLDFLILFYLF